MKMFAIVAALLLGPRAAFAELAEPSDIQLLPAATGECGIHADYVLSGAVMRVEVSGARRHEGGIIYIRAYMPNSVGPAMRDLWLKTSSLFSLGQFKPARMNSQGILEASGPLDPAATASVVREIAAGDVEVSLIFDGVLPAARLPVGLPEPLPPELADALKNCAAKLEK